VTTFNSTHHVDEPAGQIEARLTDALRQAASRSDVRTQPGLIVVTRQYRPTWAIVLAILGAIFFLLGLLFLLVKNTETLTIAVSPGRGDDCTVVISGEADEWVIRTVHGVLSKPHRRRAVVPPSHVGKPPRASDAAAATTTDELERLARLHERGRLTDEEFQLAKARLLTGESSD
jgi:hypothetical protein